MFFVEAILPSGDLLDTFGPFETKEQAAAWFDEHFHRCPEIDCVITIPAEGGI